MKNMTNVKDSKNFIKTLPAVSLVAVLTVGSLSGCLWVKPYKIDIPQGTPLHADKLAQVQVGMSQNQVLYILGSPAFRDTLNPNRWDYLYDFTGGTNAEKKRIPDVHHAKQYVKIYFDQSGVVTNIEK